MYSIPHTACRMMNPPHFTASGHQVHIGSHPFQQDINVMKIFRLEIAFIPKHCPSHRAAAAGSGKHRAEMGVVKKQYLWVYLEYCDRFKDSTGGPPLQFSNLFWRNKIARPSRGKYHLSRGSTNPRQRIEGAPVCGDFCDVDRRGLIRTLGGKFRRRDAQSSRSAADWGMCRKLLLRPGRPTLREMQEMKSLHLKLGNKRRATGVHLEYGH